LNTILLIWDRLFKTKSGRITTDMMWESLLSESVFIDFVKSEVPKYKNKTNTVSQFKIKNIFKKTYKIKESPFTSYIFDTLNSTMTEIYGEVIVNGYDYYRIPVKKHKSL
jgi:hypothetical protein